MSTSSVSVSSLCLNESESHCLQHKAQAFGLAERLAALWLESYVRCGVSARKTSRIGFGANVLREDRAASVGLLG